MKETIFLAVKSSVSMVVAAVKIHLWNADVHETTQYFCLFVLESH